MLRRPSPSLLSVLVLILALAGTAFIGLIQTSFIGPSRSAANFGVIFRGGLTLRRQQVDARTDIFGLALEPEASTLDSLDFQLDNEQRAAIDAVLAGKNVLVTGGAGVGKTHTGAAIHEALKRRYGGAFEDLVAVTAPTGSAAVLVGGATLHSVAGIGVPCGAKDFQKLRKHRKPLWMQIQVLVIDEASMISGELFDLLDQEVRHVRKDKRPFGGLQIILLGDFFQLSPIVERLDATTMEQLDQDELRNNNAMRHTYDRRGRPQKDQCFLNRGMIFQSHVFWELDFHIASLTTQHRQADDLSLAEVLNNLREGMAVDDGVEWLNSRCHRPDEWFDSDDVVTLFPRNEQVEERNRQKLAELPGAAYRFEASDSVETDNWKRLVYNDSTQETKTLTKAEKKKLLSQAAFFHDGSSACAVDSVLDFKVGASVMLIANIDTDAGLVNGALGEVLDVSQQSQKGQVLVRFSKIGEYWIGPHTFSARYPGIGTCYREQMPLRLAWAMTHHRCQGQTFDRVRVDPSTFAAGQGYVALSRARRVEGLELLRPLRRKDIIVSQAAVDFMHHVRSNDLAVAREKVGTWRDIAPVQRGGPGLGKNAPAMAADRPDCDEVFERGPYKGSSFKEAMASGYCDYALRVRAMALAPHMRRFTDCCLQAHRGGQIRA